jgi:sulfate permease, SulP family
MAHMSATHAPVEAKPPTGLARYIPIIQWLPNYRAKFLPGDAISAVTVWAMVIPEAMAYAAIAGVPVQYGLYAAPLAGLGYMIFGGSRQLFVGPDAAPAAVTAGVVVSVVGANASVEKYVSVTATLSLMVGVIFILLGLLRLGWISKFFAQPILTGFVFGLGWFIAVGQLPKIVGIHKPKGDTVNILVQTIGHVGDWKVTTLVVGVLALAVLFALSRFVPKAPAAIVVTILGIAAVGLFNLHTQHGVKVVGAVPKGFHFVPWSQVSLHDITAMIPGAFALMLVAFSQSVALAKTYAAKYHEPLDVNQEMFGYGAANLGSGILQGFAATGSLSKTSLSQEAGEKTPLSLGFTSVLVIVTILFLTGLFKNLPEAALAAIIIHAVSGSMMPAKLVRLWHANRGEFVLAALTAAGVIVINILPGILIGVLASFFLLIHRLDHPRTVLLGRSPDKHYYTNLSADGKGNGEVKEVPGVLVYGFRAPLLFTNYEDFTRNLLAQVDKAHPRPKTVVIDCDAISETDTTGSGALHDLHGTLQRANIRLKLARVDHDLLEYLRRDGVLKDLGADAVFPTVREAVDAAEGASSPARAATPVDH